MKRARSASALLVTVIVAAGCGSSDGSLLSGVPPGASAANGGARGQGGLSVEPVSGARAPAKPGPAASAGAGAPGGAAGVCSGASCGTPHPGGLPPGAACTERSDCASGRCEPKTGTTDVICLGACFADGAPCERALDCCSTGCHAGKCGGLCTVIGDDCSKDADCCSNICSGGRCEVDRANADCRPTGEDCTSGHSRGCCHECDDRTKRCSFGSDTCFAQGVACTADSQCCRGVCTAGKCATPCSADGAACTSNAACCSAICGATGQCSTPPPVADGGTSCTPTQGRCTVSAECCSGQCFGGFCEAALR